MLEKEDYPQAIHDKSPTLPEFEAVWSKRAKGQSQNLSRKELNLLQSFRTVGKKPGNLSIESLVGQGWQMRDD